MKYPEEDIAADLHRALERKFESAPTEISISGAGVRWHCTAERDNSRCTINCFMWLGGEYYTHFTRDSVDLATSRIPSRDDTVAAVGDWLDGHDLPFLYDRYPFVDQKKRALTKIHDEAIARAPELQCNAHPELENTYGDFCYLRFRSKDRSCVISFYGKNELPDAKFSWDDCQLFQFQPDDNQPLALVLKRWICDGAMPSEMRTRFPWLEIGELADYYERGKPIEGEFVQSWDFIEDYYQADWCTFSDAVLLMIHEMRAAGYDRVVRAGQSLSSLGLSRSRRHGLKDGQHWIWFEFRDSAMNVRASFDSYGLKDQPIRFTTEVQQLLDALVDLDID